MKKITTLVILLAASLWAADFWQAKPFTEWNDKDTHKMIENSPWAKPFSLANSLPSNSGGKRGGGGGAAADPMTDISQSGMGGGGRSRGGGGDNGDEMRAGAPPTLIVRWQASLPVKQALLRIKYGSEAATAPEAKQFLENRGDDYVVGVIGVAQRLLQGAPAVQIKRDLIEYTFLSVKGRDDLHPSDVQFGKATQSVDMYFLFPKKTPFTLDDKEIEFTAKIGTLVVKQRFRLKDMVINGKLEL